MQDFIYMGKKALLVTTDDLAPLSRGLSYHWKTQLQAKLDTLRGLGYKFVFVVTSLEFAALPKEFRDMYIHEKHCFVGMVPGGE